MNAFLDNDMCEDELNHGDCMFDGFDCCGYDSNDDGDHDDYFDVAPGDTTLCTECLCKGMHKFKKYLLRSRLCKEHCYRKKAASVGQNGF
jgi:hypothetical protein